MNNYSFSFLVLDTNIRNYLKKCKKNKFVQLNYISTLYTNKLSTVAKPNNNNRLVLLDNTTKIFYYFPILDRLIKEEFTDILKFIKIESLENNKKQCTVKINLPDNDIDYEINEYYMFKSVDFKYITLSEIPSQTS